MIRLVKLNEPQILRDNKKRWTKDYSKAKAAGKIPDGVRYRYRHGEIKSKIRLETSDKCAYCESKITHTYPGDIEHILPISKFPHYIFEWRNLTLGCGECNRRKSDYHSDTEPLLDPYVDNPGDHLIAIGPIVYGQPGNKKGYITELKLALNRIELLERRSERINSIRNLAERYASQEEGELKQLLKKELMKEIDRDKEYSFTSREFLKVFISIA